MQTEEKNIYLDLVLKLGTLISQAHVLNRATAEYPDNEIFQKCAVFLRDEIDKTMIKIIKAGRES